MSAIVHSNVIPITYRGHTWKPDISTHHHLICPLTQESLRSHWWCDSFPPSCSINGCLLGPANEEASPLLDVVLPLLPLSAPPSSSWHSALQDVFCETSWLADMTILLQLTLLNHCQKVLKGQMAALIQLHTYLLVMWSLYEMCRILQRLLISMAWILLCKYAIRVHVSHSCRIIVVTSVYISLTLDLKVIFCLSR